MDPYSYHWSQTASPLVQGANTFAKGFVGTALELEKFDESTRRWEQTFQRQLAVQDRSYKFAQEQYQFEVKKYEDGQLMRDLQLETAQLTKKVGEASFKRSETKWEDTEQGMAFFMERLPAMITDTSLAKRGVATSDLIMQAASSFPHMDIESLEMFVSMIDKTGVLGGKGGTIVKGAVITRRGEDYQTYIDNKSGAMTFQTLGKHSDGVIETLEDIEAEYDNFIADIFKAQKLASGGFELIFKEGEEDPIEKAHLLERVVTDIRRNVADKLPEFVDKHAAKLKTFVLNDKGKPDVEKIKEVLLNRFGGNLEDIEYRRRIKEMQKKNPSYGMTPEKATEWFDELESAAGEDISASMTTMYARIQETKEADPDGTAILMDEYMKRRRELPPQDRRSLLEFEVRFLRGTFGAPEELPSGDFMGILEEDLGAESIGDRWRRELLLEE